MNQTLIPIKDPAASNGRGEKLQPVQVIDDGDDTEIIHAEFNIIPEDDLVQADFVGADNLVLFRVELFKSKLNWGAMKAIRGFQRMADTKDDGAEDGLAQMDMILDFYDTYVVGGCEQVPFEHTPKVMQAIAEYMQAVMKTTQKK